MRRRREEAAPPLKEASSFSWLAGDPAFVVGFATTAIDLQNVPIEISQSENLGRLPLTGLERHATLPLAMDHAMAAFAADALVQVAVVPVLHDAVMSLAAAGVFAQLWPGRSVVVVADEPFSRVLYVHAG